MALKRIPEGPCLTWRLGNSFLICFLILDKQMYSVVHVSFFISFLHNLVCLSEVKHLFMRETWSIRLWHQIKKTIKQKKNKSFSINHSLPHYFVPLPQSHLVAYSTMRALNSSWHSPKSVLNIGTFKKIQSSEHSSCSILNLFIVTYAAHFVGGFNIQKIPRYKTVTDQKRASKVHKYV